MKKWIYAQTDVTDLKKKISSALYDFIRYELWEQSRNGYYKQIRKQFTVNGVKYTVKNDAKGKLHILTPEGDDMYGYAIPSYISYETTDEMALEMINDAFNYDVDLSNKRVPLSLRVNYQYGSGGVVTFGEYLKTLRNWFPENSDKRYAAVTYRYWWSGHDNDCKYFDELDQALNYAQTFVAKGAKTQSKDRGGLDYDYTYQADVIDTETGMELYYNESESIPLDK